MSWKIQSGALASHVSWRCPSSGPASDREHTETSCCPASSGRFPLGQKTLKYYHSKLCTCLYFVVYGLCLFMISSHVVVESSFRMHCHLTHMAIVSKEVFEMFCFNMISHTGCGPVWKVLAYGAKMNTSIRIFLDENLQIFWTLYS